MSSRKVHQMKKVKRRLRTTAADVRGHVHAPPGMHNAVSEFDIIIHPLV
jgi:hypothetical protein